MTVNLATPCKYYYVQTGGPWTEATDLSAVSWVDQDDLANGARGAWRPVQFTKHIGHVPSELTVRVTGSYTGGVSPMKATTHIDSAQLPDGLSGDLPCPIQVDGGDEAPIHQFELVRLMEAASWSTEDKAAAVSRFVGVVLNAEWDLTAEEWTLTVVEIARWHMGKIAVSGIQVHRIASTGGAEFQRIDNALPVFNDDGKADQDTADNGTRALYFINANYNSIDGVQQKTGDYASFWRYGDIMNYLRASYTYGGYCGYVATDNYLVWDEAGETTVWPFLFTDSSNNPNIARNFSLGGMSLAKAIDVILRKAGKYEWACEWNAGENKYDLEIWDAIAGNGDTETDYARQALGADMNTVDRPTVAGGRLTWNWEETLTRIKALGALKRVETTCSTLVSVYGTLAQGWTAGPQTVYDAATAANKNSVELQSVYQRFILPNQPQWDYAFSADASANVKHFDGPRAPLNHILSMVTAANSDDSLTPLRLCILAWRYKGAAWEAMPASVNVSAHHDGSIRISGHAEGEKERWAEKPAAAGAYDIAITLAVTADERLTTATSPLSDKPSGWPTLEACIDSPEFVHEARKLAYLPHDNTGSGDHPGEPVMDNPAATGTFGGTDVDVIRDDALKLEAEARRTLDIFTRPRLHGTLIITDFDFSMKPGKRIGSLTGGGDREDALIVGIVGGVSYVNFEGPGPHRMHLAIGSAVA